MNKLLKRLGDLHQREFVLLTANASTAIFCALKALDLHKAKVAIPNSICFDVPLAIRMSGNFPVFVDIMPGNLGLSVAQLEKESLDAVIAVHAYGAVCDIKALVSYCRRRQIPLIEDFAVAQGGSAEGQPLGSFGDISVVSFGAGKIIDVGHGGALLTNSRELYAECKKIVSKLPVSRRDEEVDELSRFHTCLYNEHYASGNINKYYKEFQRRAESAFTAVLMQFDQKYGEAISRKLDVLENTVNIRKERNAWFQNQFKGMENTGLSIFNYPDGSVPWRCNFFIEVGRDKLLRKLLDANYKISSWYPSVDLFFTDRGKVRSQTPVSDRIGDIILNTWVNEDIDEKYMSSISEQIYSNVCTSVEKSLQSQQ